MNCSNATGRARHHVCLALTGTHDVCARQHKPDGAFVDFLHRKEVWIFVKEFEMGVKGTVALLKEEELAVDRVELHVVLALDFMQRRLLWHQRVEERLPKKCFYDYVFVVFF